MGIALSSLVGTLNIQRILIAGDMVRFGAPLLDTIKDTMARTMLGRLVQQTHVAFDHLGRTEIILGASAMVLKDLALLFDRPRTEVAP
jgi:hypothetical protein